MPHVLDPGYCNNIYNQGYFTTDRDEENKRKDLNKAVGQVSIWFSRLTQKSNQMQPAWAKMLLISTKKLPNCNFPSLGQSL